MDITDIILTLVGIIVTMLGFFLVRMADDMKSLEKQITTCQTDLPKQYVMKDEYRADVDEIKSTLKDIFKILREHEKSGTRD